MRAPRRPVVPRALRGGRTGARGLGTVLVVVAAAFAWWSTGLRPFTITVYVAIAIPVAALVLVGLARRRGARADVSRRPPVPTRHFGVGTTFPWITLLALVVGLESAGLALGGRSRGVPTLSTVVDHALAWHGIRFLMFMAWIAVGWVPTMRPLWHRRGEQAD